MARLHKGCKDGLEPAAYPYTVATSSIAWGMGPWYGSAACLSAKAVPSVRALPAWLNLLRHGMGQHAASCRADGFGGHGSLPRSRGREPPLAGRACADREGQPGGR